MPVRYAVYLFTTLAVIPTVSVIGTAKNTVAASFTAGPGSNAVALPSPGVAWVANSSNNTISIINLASGAVEKTIPLKLQPWLIASNPDSNRVYVVTGNFTGSLSHFSSTLLEYNAKTSGLIGGAAIPNDGLVNPGLAISADNSTVYATFDSQSIIVFHAASGTVSSVWKTRRALSSSPAIGTLTLSPDGATLYTAGQALTAIDTKSGSVLGSVTPPGPPKTYSFSGSVVTSDGSVLYAAYFGQFQTGGFVASINTEDFTVTGSTPVGSSPEEPVLSKDGSTLYVPDTLNSLVYVMSTAGLTIEKSIAVAGQIAAVTLNASGTELYVPNSSTASVRAVDTSSFAVTASIGVSGTGDLTVGLFGTTPPSATASGAAIFTGGIQPNVVTEIDGNTNKVVRQFSDNAGSESETGLNAATLLVTPNGKQVYLGANNFVEEVPVIETATGTVSGVKCPDSCAIFEMVALPDSTRVYLSGSKPIGDDGSQAIFWEVDTATLTVVARVSLAMVSAIAASPSGSFLYVGTASGIDVLNTSQNTVTGVVPVNGAAGIASRRMVRRLMQPPVPNSM